MAWPPGVKMELLRSGGGVERRERRRLGPEAKLVWSR